MSKKKNRKFKLKNIESDPTLQHNSANKTIIPIIGMHCRSCEILIEEKLKELPEIKNVQVSYKKAEAIIHSDHPLDLLELDKINRAIKEVGYEVGVEDSKDWISKNPSEYYDLLLALIVLVSLYYFAKGLGLFNLSFGSNNPTGLLVVLIVGLTAGVSTCMALVGGLILGISARHSEKHPEATTVQKFRPHLYFNLGRIASYFFLGGIIGLAGKVFQLSGTSLGLLIIVVGLVMLMMGLQLTELFPRLSNGGLTLPSSVSKFFGIKKHHDKEYSHINSIIIGALTFFLPCGFTQAMQLYAMSTGNFFSGALIMGTFAVGTAPGLLSIGGLTSVLKGTFAKKFFKFAGVLVIALSLFNISNGANLTGWKPSLKKNTVAQETVNDPNVTLENGVQVVKMDQLAGGYKPNSFTIKKGIPVKWVINSKKSDSCSASILAPKIGVKKFLESGENIIEFTPKEVGEIKFSCSMGMYTGKFIVVEGGAFVLPPSENNPSGRTAPTADPKANQITPPQTSPPSSSNQPAPSDTKKEQPTQNQTPPVADIQIIKTTFVSPAKDITPNLFNVKVNQPVRFEIAVEADGEGCMGSIMVPGLVNKPEFFNKGQTIVFEFTPTKKGDYDITCAMGSPRGIISVG